MRVQLLAAFAFSTALSACAAAPPGRVEAPPPSPPASDQKPTAAKTESTPLPVEAAPIPPAPEACKIFAERKPAAGPACTDAKTARDALAVALGKDGDVRDAQLMA